MKPHIILFNVDQWRGDALGHLGNPAARTPVLDELVATEAVSYRHNVCQNPHCVPSRCSFLTGWYPHTRGHRTMRHVLDPDTGDRMLLRELRQAGYHVFWGGKNDVVAEDPGRSPYADRISDESRYTKQPNWHGPVLREARGEPGSDTYYSFHIGKMRKRPGEAYYHDDDWMHVQEAIRQVRGRPPDKPLCLYLALTFPHPPYGVEEPFFSAIDRDALPPRIRDADYAGKGAIIRDLRPEQGLVNWSEERWDELRATYYGMCMRIDSLLGDLILVLKEEGLWKDSLLCFFGDHGDFTGDYDLVEKADTAFEDCIARTPLIVKPPTGMPCVPGVRDSLTENIDMTETVYDTAGLNPEYIRFGRSLRQSLADPGAGHRDAVFCEGGRLPEEPMADRTADKPDPDSPYYPKQVLMSREAGCAASMCRTRDWKYIRRMRGPDELYDLRNDPRETRNLIDDPARAPILAGLRERMLQWYQETGSVLPSTTANEGRCLPYA